MAVAKLNLVFMDSQSSLSKVTIPLATINSGNFSSQVAQAAFTVATSIAHLIADCSLGTPVASSIEVNVDKNAPVPASNMFSQRELGLQVSYADTVTGKKYHLTIPAPDWTNLGNPGSNKVNTSSAAWSALVAGLESGMVSEVGNAISVTGGRLIGRK